MRIETASWAGTALLFILLALGGSAAAATLAFCVPAVRRTQAELPWIARGAIAGLGVAFLARGWAAPAWLAFPALWALLALFMIAPPKWLPRPGGADGGWDQTRLLLLPVTGPVVLGRRLAARLAARPAPVPGWIIAVVAALDCAIPAIVLLRVPVVGYHAVGAVLGLWAGVALALRARTISPARLLLAGPAIGLAVASELWRHDFVAPRAWAPVVGCVAAVALLFVSAGRRQAVRALVARQRDLERARALASPVLVAGLVGLGGGALAMPGGWRLIGAATLLAGLGALAVGGRQGRASKDDVVHARRWWVHAALAALVLMSTIDATALNVALPTLVADLPGTTAGDLQWIVDAYLLVFGALLLTTGSLGDRFGRWRLFRLGLVVFGTASILAAWAASAEQLIVARGILGAGAALALPAALPTLGRVFSDDRERKTAIRIWSAAAAVGVAAGPLLGGWLVETADWRWIFFINAPVVGLALAIALWVVPESRGAGAKLDPLGGLLFAGALVALLWAIIDSRSAGWTAVPVLVGFGAAAVLVAAFAAWERWGTRHPMVAGGLFRVPGYIAGAASIGLMNFALVGGAFILTFYLQGVLGFGPIEAGAALLPVALGIVIGTVASTRFHRLPLVGVAVALATMAAGLVGLALVTVDSGYWAPVLPSLAAIGLAMGLGNACGNASIEASLPQNRAGAASGLDNTLRQVGGALGVAVLGSLLGARYAGGIADSGVLTSLPPGPAAVAGDSLAAALAVARQIGVPGVAEALRAAATEAFVHAMVITAAWAALVLTVGATGVGLVVIHAGRRRGTGSSKRPPAGTDLKVEIRGRDNTGAVIIVVPGFLSGFHAWERVVAILENKGYVLVVPQMPWTIPGARISVRGSVLPQARARLDELITLVESRYPGREIFAFGHSFGGGFLLTCAGALRVTRVGTLCPAGLDMVRDVLWVGRRYIMILRWVPRFDRLVARLARSRQQRSKHAVVKAVLGKMATLGGAATALSAGPRMVYELRRALLPLDLAIGRRRPATWFSADDTFVLPRSAQVAWVQLQTDVTVADTGGHDPHVQTPEAVAAWIHLTCRPGA